DHGGGARPGCEGGGRGAELRGVDDRRHRCRCEDRRRRLSSRRTRDGRGARRTRVPPRSRPPTAAGPQGRRADRPPFHETLVASRKDMIDDTATNLPRAAMLSVHTSPVDQPGVGDSGGMNVYIRSVATRLEQRGIDVDLFTRCRGGEDHETKHLTKHAHVVSIKAGPCEPIPKAELPRYLPEFLGGVIQHSRVNDRRYDLVHSHYWLSGWVGNALHDLWDVPLVSSFHTLGKVKNYLLASGETPEPPERIAGEMRVIGDSERILAPTPAEAGQLVGLYRADPDHIRIVPGGVDHAMFTPRDRERSRNRLYLRGLRMALFVERLQPHKGPDIAIRTVAAAIAHDPVTTRDLQLAIVGGPSGTDVGEIDRLMDLIAALGINDRVMFFPPQPQER